ncbi:hypothetical protein PSMK_08390 [Phycisphaera mikurensis NBRC 102666]|uniref:Uncharacterized protein n=1 Tax=Phycisphaera mikurensis (strain NBRC 102666 / KCTC 22515 / FYK2301M01) TaxID=1142394 RepID=I0ICL0_PHYMF|nr:hypothetical protein PSMK_08390 [Phycisphaera mikurensis NBRC 102666]
MLRVGHPPKLRGSRRALPRRRGVGVRADPSAGCGPAGSDRAEAAGGSRGRGRPRPRTVAP